MTSYQWVIFLTFLSSYTIRTAVTCFALELIISNYGSERLGSAYSMAAVITVSAVVLMSLASKRYPSIIRFLFLHGIIALVAATCLVIENPAIQAQLAFFCIVGFGLLIYFSNWSVALAYISPFESKRLFPWMGMAAQIGVFCGSILAMLSNLGFPKEYYFPVWFLIECGVIALALSLTRTEESKENSAFFFLDDEEDEDGPKEEEEKLGIIALFRQYQLLPRMSLWIFLWGFTYTAFLSLVAAEFQASGANLTALYGMLALSGSALGSLVSAFVFPILVRMVRLGSVLLVCSGLASVVGFAYISFRTFVVAVVVYLCFELSAASFKALAVNTEIGLYPERYRDQIRLFGEILPQSLGAALVGFAIAGFTKFTAGVLGVALLFLMVAAFRAREGFNKEVISLLKTGDEEERRNATALYDRLEHQDEYEHFLYQLLEGDDLATRINILKTFASLKTSKPLPDILNLLTPDVDASLRIAILRYVDELDFKEFDPFLQYRTIEMLKDICLNSFSNVARAMAIKTFVQHAAPEASVKFVMQELESEDDRIVANAIDGLRHMSYPGVVSLLIPYLRHETPRIRANAIVSLWGYPKSRFQVKAALTTMLYSENLGHKISAIYAVGKVGELSFQDYLVTQLDSGNPSLHRISLISLLQLGVEEHIDEVVELILGEDEGQAINTCYLSVSLSSELLNEGIIASIFYRGGDARRLAITRYTRCGAFCREQLELLSGQVTAAQSTI